MMDKRLMLANRRVAHSSLKGKIDGVEFVDGDMRMCRSSVADIMDKPNGQRVSQLVHGELFLTIENKNGYVFGATEKDGYCGYIRSDQLVDPIKPTHWVCVPATHLYPEPDLKVMTEGTLYLGSEVRIEFGEGTWARVSDEAWVPTSHLVPLSTRLSDPVSVADLFFGTPYLWGGSTRYGIDCSGMIQASWRACGLDCPRDSDMQEAEIGKVLDAGAPLQRGDLVFWKGHVGIMTNENTLLHANSYHMCAAQEPIDDAIQRIEASGGGAVTSIKRP
jgi:cell wall-associated NlpC family hydrolase